MELGIVEGILALFIAALGVWNLQVRRSIASERAIRERERREDQLTAAHAQAHLGAHPHLIYR